jgi:2'-5' RNA ligase
LYTALKTKLQRLDIPLENRFHPHITLARHATGMSFPEKTWQHVLQWHVTRYALVKSQRLQGGSYKVLQYFETKGEHNEMD